MAAHATLFLRKGRVDGAEYDLTVDIKEFGNRLRVRHRGKSLDGFGHFLI
jgi:hypothetical protein